MPADLCKLEDMLTKEDKDKKEQLKAESNQVFFDKINHQKLQEENTRILEDAIHESLGQAVDKCNELIKSDDTSAQLAHVKKMLQPPTKAERCKWSGDDESTVVDATPPTLSQFRDWL